MKVQRIISFATLAISIFTLVLVLRRPAPVAPALAPAVLTAAGAQRSWTARGSVNVG